MFALNAEFQHNAINPGYGAKFKLGSVDFAIIVSPTQNCQTASIGPMDAAFSLLKDKGNEEMVAEIKRLVGVCYGKIPAKPPKLLMFDVAEEHVKDVKSCFNGKVKAQLSGGENRVVFLIDVQNIVAVASIP